MRQRSWRVVGSLSALGLVLMVAAYFLPAPGASVSGDISYLADWEWGSAEPVPDGGWTVENNLGYRVQVRDGYVLSYSAVLNQCQHQHRLIDWLLSKLLTPTAQAGHSTNADPAQTRVSLTESLAAPTASEWGTVTVNEPAYCRGHYLTAVNGTESSLYIEGRYQRGGDAQPFMLNTAQAWGALDDLSSVDGASVHVQPGSEPIRVRVIRPLDTLFDDADFAAMDADTFARTVLRHLAEDTRFEVVSGSVHAN